MTSFTKHLLALSLALALAGPLGLQAQVNARLEARDTVDLSIIRVYPDSFPEVALYFKAASRSGQPLWQFPKEKVTVLEDGEERPVISLRPVSEYTPIQIALVVDHSSSMLDEFIYQFDTIGDFISVKTIGMRKKGEPLAIDRAKEGVIEFVKSLRNDRDSLLVVGFSSIVDPVPPMTNDTMGILRQVRAMKADGTTAFYDALRTGLDSLEHYQGLRAVVALTDGMDNASQTTLDSVIHRAQGSEIPVYVIGLGNVDKLSLAKLAESTDGEFFYTDQSNSLAEIYLRISNRLQAIYELVYRSTTLGSSAATQREVEILFDIDTLYFGQPLEVLDLPESAIMVMKEREQNTQLYLAGGMGLLALAALGLLVLNRRRKEEEVPAPAPAPLPEILPTPVAFPNPSTGHVYFKADLPDGVLSTELTITNLSGEVLRQFTLSGNHPIMELDLGSYPNGTYLYRLSNAEGVSKAGKLVIRK